MAAQAHIGAAAALRLSSALWVSLLSELSCFMLPGYYFAAVHHSAVSALMTTLFTIAARTFTPPSMH